MIARPWHFLPTLLLVLLAGCQSAEIPPDERLLAPTLIGLSGPRVGEALEWRSYELGAADERAAELAVVLRRLIPEDAWKPEGATVEARQGQRFVYQTPTTHAFIDRLMEQRGAPGIGTLLSLRVYDIRSETANTLGPLDAAEGAGEAVHMFKVPLAARALRRLETLSERGLATKVYETAVRIRPWSLRKLSALSQSAYIRGLDFRNAAGTRTGIAMAGPEIGQAQQGFELEVAVVACAGDTLLSFDFSESVLLARPEVMSRAFADRTLLPLQLPLLLRHRARDRIRLRPGESLALLRLGADGGRLIVLTPGLEG